MIFKDNKYVAYGPVRGECTHYHRTIDAAVRCCSKDMKHCKAVGGYSDRGVKILLAHSHQLSPLSNDDAEYANMLETYFYD